MRLRKPCVPSAALLAIVVVFTPKPLGAGTLTPAGSASNTAAMTFGPFSSTGSILGLQVWDGSPVASSDMLWYGTLQTARTIGVGDTLIVAAGALVITMS